MGYWYKIQKKRKWRHLKRPLSATRRIKAIAIKTIVLVLVIFECSTFLTLLIPKTAQAASLTVASAISETEQTTASTTFTASDTAVASGSLPAGTYLVTWGAEVANSSNANLASVRLLRGATEVSALAHESMAATAASMGIASSGYWLGALSGSEALTIEYKGSAGTTYIDSKFIKAIRIDANLTIDADYFTSGPQESVTDQTVNAATGSWTTIRTLTKTFSSFDTENYLVFASMEASPDSTTNDCSSMLEVDGVASTASTVEGENIADESGYSLAKIYSIGTGSKNIKLQGQSVGGATCDFRRTRIYVFRASLFDQAVENYSAGESTLASTTWTDKNSQVYTPNQSETVMVVGSRLQGSDNVSCPIATRFNDGTNNYVDTHAFTPNNVTDYASGMSAITLTVSSATTFKAQFQRVTGSCTVKIKESSLIIWSMTLRDPAAYDQSAYRWFDDDTLSPWWNNSWLSRRKITLNNSQSTENLTDFPLRVSLTSSNIDYSKTQNSGQDIRFVDANGTTLLKHEIERWDESGTSEVWTKVPQVDSGSTTDYIWMYYNNTSAVDGQDKNNVWNSAYKAIWHMGENPGGTGPQIIDSTAGAHNGTSEGTMTSGNSVTGPVGKGVSFDGVDDDIAVPHHTDLLLNGSFSVNYWLKLNADPEGASWPSIFNKGSGSTVNNGWMIYETASTNAMGYKRDGTFANSTSPDGDATASNYQHFDVVYDSSAHTITGYTNGVANIQTTGITFLTDTSTNTLLMAAGDEWANISLDEIRFSNTARSAEWIEADYKSQNNQMNSFGTEEPGTGFTPLAAANTAYTLTSDGEAFRLRMLMHVANSDLPTGFQSFKLQVAQKSGTCDTGYSGETYGDVGTASGAIRYKDLTGETDGAAMVPDPDDPTHSSHAILTQAHEEANNFTSISRVNRGEDGKWEFALVDFSAPSAASYCFRVVKSDGSPIATPEVVPEITTTNTSPTNPASLAQKKTDDTVLATGAWVSATSVKFTATVSDPDVSDTLQLCVEKDLLGTGFSNTEDSCGTGVTYAGTGLEATVTISGITDASEYHWQARVKDAGGLYSSWISYDVNAESARDFGTDTTAPTGGTVYDGTTTNVDTTFSGTSLSDLSANWSGFNFAASGILKYEYSIGTTPGGTDTKNWTDNTTNTSVTATGLTLQSSKVYYVNVRATDNAGNTVIRSSNGQLVAPSVSFSVSPSILTFNSLKAGNAYTNTQPTTLTTSTNAYGGYVIRAFASDFLRSPGNFTLGDFNGGTYASPDSWQSGDTGLGYTSSDTDIQGTNKFQVNPCPGGSALAAPGCYAPFTQTKPGDIVADHTGNVSGSPIVSEPFTITLRATVTALQQATNYQTTLVYAITPIY